MSESPQSGLCRPWPRCCPFSPVCSCSSAWQMFELPEMLPITLGSWCASPARFVTTDHLSSALDLSLMLPNPGKMHLTLSPSRVEPSILEHRCNSVLLASTTLALPLLPLKYLMSGGNSVSLPLLLMPVAPLCLSELVGAGETKTPFGLPALLLLSCPQRLQPSVLMSLPLSAVVWPLARHVPSSLWVMTLALLMLTLSDPETLSPAPVPFGISCHC